MHDQSNQIRICNVARITGVITKVHKSKVDICGLDSYGEISGNDCWNRYIMSLVCGRNRSGRRSI